MKDILNEVRTLAEECGELMRIAPEIYKSKGSDANYVTSTDVKVQAVLKERLLSILPGSAFYGEENDCRETAEYTFIVDPIDGTANYVHGLNSSVISIALKHEGEGVVFALVHDPYRRETFHAEKGKGAYLNGERIRVSDRNLGHSIFCTSLSVYRKEFASELGEILLEMFPKCEDFRRFGSAALELCYVAAGRVEMYFELGDNAWDAAAGMLLVTEAGGFVGIIDDNYNYDGPAPIFAANSKQNFETLECAVKKRFKTNPFPKND